MAKVRSRTYLKWFDLLCKIPPLHAAKVQNRQVIVNNYIMWLKKRRYVRPFQFRLRRMRDGSCMIFHYSSRDFGELIKPRSVRKFYDWDAIFVAIPPGFGREINANLQTVRSAIRTHERNERIIRGEFHPIQQRKGKSTRVLLCHRQGHDAA